MERLRMDWANGRSAQPRLAGQLPVLLRHAGGDCGTPIDRPRRAPDRKRQGFGAVELRNS